MVAKGLGLPKSIVVPEVCQVVAPVDPDSNRPFPEIAWRVSILCPRAETNARTQACTCVAPARWKCILNNGRFWYAYAVCKSAACKSKRSTILLAPEDDEEGSKPSVHQKGVRFLRVPPLKQSLNPALCMQCSDNKLYHYAWSLE